MKDLLTLNQEDIAILAWKKKELEINVEINTLSSKLYELETTYREFLKNKAVELEQQWKKEIEELNSKLSVLNLKVLFQDIEKWWGHYRNDFSYKRELDWKSGFRLNYAMVDLEAEANDDGVYDIQDFLIKRCNPNFENYYEFSFKELYPALFEKCLTLYIEINKVKEELTTKTKFIEDFRAALTLHKLSVSDDANNLYNSVIENMKLLQ
jgi:hypothetical protein